MYNKDIAHIVYASDDRFAEILGVSPSTAYLIMKEKGFPTLKIGHRMVVPKDKFIQWIEANTGV